jgi:hypothetical protein
MQILAVEAAFEGRIEQGCGLSHQVQEAAGVEGKWERGAQRRLAVVFAAFFAVTALLLVNEAMVRGLGHDEHQFIASARLLADQGLWPYLDYPYFHLPYMAGLYALVFQFTMAGFLAARLVSVLAALAALAVICLLIYRRVQGRALWLAAGIPLSCCLMLVFNPIFTYTSGQAWNHDVAVALAVFAFSAVSRASQGNGGPRWAGIGGVLLGLAAGVRLPFVVLAVPAAGWLLAQPAQTAKAGPRWALPGWLAAGFGLALLPAGALFTLAPRQFVFGNLGYPRLNTLYRLETGFQGRMDLSGKLAYLARVVLTEPGTLVLVLGLAVLVLAARAKGRRGPDGANIWLALLFALFLGLSGFGATPSFLQYFYAPIPFLVLAAGFGLARVQGQAGRLHPLVGLWYLGVVAAALVGSDAYPPIQRLFAPQEWETYRVHQAGLEIARRTREGNILTLAPIYPLEGGAGIYPPLATGPFAWRTAHLLEPQARELFGIVGPANLDVVLAEDPPAGILVGPEGELEQGLVAFARSRGYRAEQIAPGLELWLPP